MKSIVHVLGTLFCTYVQRPTMKNCRTVSISCLQVCLTQRSSEWNIYINACVSIPKYTGLLDAISLYPLPKHQQSIRQFSFCSSTKRAEIRSTERNNYASVSMPEDGEEANRRNVASLKQEVLKGTTRLEATKSLVCRTFPHRRRHILEDQCCVGRNVDWNFSS